MEWVGLAICLLFYDCALIISLLSRQLRNGRRGAAAVSSSSECLIVTNAIARTQSSTPKVLIRSSSGIRATDGDPCAGMSKPLVAYSPARSLSPLSPLLRQHNRKKGASWRHRRAAFRLMYVAAAAPARKR